MIKGIDLAVWSFLQGFWVLVGIAAWQQGDRSDWRGKATMMVALALAVWWVGYAWLHVGSLV